MSSENYLDRLQQIREKYGCSKNSYTASQQIPLNSSKKVRFTDENTYAHVSRKPKFTENPEVTTKIASDFLFDRSSSRNQSRAEKIKEIEAIRQSYANSRKRTINEFSKQNFGETMKNPKYSAETFDFKHELKREMNYPRQRRELHKAIEPRDLIMRELGGNEYQANLGHTFTEMNQKPRHSSIRRDDNNRNTSPMKNLLKLQTSYGLDSHRPRSMSTFGETKNDILQMHRKRQGHLHSDSMSPIKGLERQTKNTWDVSNMNIIQQRIQTILGKK